MSKLIDSNLVIRFLLQDHPNQSPGASKLFYNKDETLYLTDIVIAEVIWVLTSFYKIPKEDVIEKIYTLLDLPNTISNRTLLVRALYLYRNFNIAFIDSYLLAYCEGEKLEGIYSFDEGLDKVKTVKRFKP